MLTIAKSWELIVNRDVDAYTGTWFHQETPRKTQKNILIPKYKLSKNQFLQLVCQGCRFVLLSVTPLRAVCHVILYILNNETLKWAACGPWVGHSCSRVCCLKRRVTHFSCLCLGRRVARKQICGWARIMQNSCLYAFMTIFGQWHSNCNPPKFRPSGYVRESASF